MCCEVIASRDESGRLVCSPHCGPRERASRHELVPTQDVRVRTHGGRERWLNLSTVVVPSKWRDLVVLVHLLRDVTREKEVERFVHQLLAAGAKFSMPVGTEPLIGPNLPPTSKDLTDREREVLGILALGTSTKAIAQRLFLSPSTVRNHITHILAKLDVRSRLEADTFAMRSGLL